MLETRAAAMLTTAATPSTLIQIVAIRSLGLSRYIRPCIVIDPPRRTDVGGYMRVAYGVRLDKAANSGADLCIESARDRVFCGLDEPTRFSMWRTALIPINGRYLDLENGFIIGALPSWREREFQTRLIQAGLRPRPSAA